MFLVVLLLVQMLPAEVLAAEQLEIGEMVTIPTQKPATEEEVHIVGELTDKRTEYSKEYVLSNGLHMASVYSQAIHYQENGQWKDIDNTLRTVGAGSEAAYANTSGIWDVSLPQELSQEKGITVTKDGYSLTFYMSGELRTPSLEIMSTSTMQIGAASLALTEAVSAEAQVQIVDVSQDKAQAQYPETVLENLRSRLEYENVYADTRIVYDLTSNHLKESIILERYSDTLRGYRYTLDTGELTPVLSDSGEIGFFGKDSKEPVMIMEAPFLMDSADAYCGDVEVELEKTGDSYTLVYLLPQSWLASEERQWPVILDPVVSGKVTSSNVEDRCVYSGGYAEPGATVLQCGYGGNGLGIMRIYMRYKELPAIESSDVIVSATAQMYKVFDYGNTTPVEVHRVTESWSEQTITWNTQTENQFDSRVEDFAVCKEKDHYWWDVTDIVRGWYEENNYGMVFKCPQSVEESTTTNMQRFASSDYYTYDESEKPQLLITFRNNNGLEGYWDYTSASAGRAGTGYINNYSGNLVWVRGDLGFGGCLMPVSISHVYNSNDSTEDSFGMGYGWRTNYNQKVKLWDNPDAVTTYYVWEDGDGTAHYFHQNEENGPYVDEDGLELTLSVTNTGYTLTDKLGNNSYFDGKGLLIGQENNQAEKSSIQITYSDQDLIETITDSAGRKYVFYYEGEDDNKLLTKISYLGMGTQEIACVSYGYNTAGQLVSVTDQDGEVSTYGYNTDANSTLPNLLLTAQDIDGYSLTYAYTGGIAGRAARVASVTERDDSTQGGSLTITYQKNQTTFEDHDGNVQVMQFNNLGNTLSIQDDQGRAQYALYSADEGTPVDQVQTTKPNQLTMASRMQNTVVNLLPQGSFEENQPWTALSGATLTHQTGIAYLGSNSLKIVSSGDGTSGAASPSFSVEVGKVYTFSAFVKTSGPSVCLALSDGSTAVTGQSLDYDSENPGWARLQVSYTAPTSGTVTAQVLTEGPGNVYIDCVQVEKAPTASRYNLVENGDFRGTNAWNGNASIVTANSTAAPELNNGVYELTGSYNAVNRVSQDIIVSGDEGDCFVLSGWAKGDSAPLGEHYGVNRRFALMATFYNGEAQVGDSVVVSFNPYVRGNLHLDPEEISPEEISPEDETRWQNAAGALVAPGPYTKITLELAYDYNVNSAIFDGIALYKEAFGASYAYDDNGNVQFVEDAQGVNTVYQYADNGVDLLNVWENVGPDEIPDGTDYPQRDPDITYTYDAHHNMTSSVSPEGITTAYTYDQYGNVTQVSVTAPGSTVPMVTKSTYTEDGNLLLSTEDAAGNITRYGYNPDTNLLEWVQYPNDTEATRTNYTYDEDTFRVEGVSAAIDADTTLSVGYTYEDDLLKTIVTPTSTYGFTHGDFGLRTAIKVGNQTLASYEYTNDRNFYLKKLAYGNGDVVQYTYDDQGRVISQTYENGDTLTYRYDNTGALAAVTDSATGRTTTYYYDLANRQMQYLESGEGFSHSVGYAYDKENLLTALVETINGRAYTTEYAYDEHDRLSTVTNEGSDLSLEYDGYGRVAKQVLTREGRTILTVEYAYRNPSETTTTGQIASITIGTNGASRSYTYSYDANGNITSVTEGNNATTYTYDKAGQLLRENNQAAGKTWVWEYDNAGNIETRTEYAYTTGSLGEALDTVEYAYNNDNWGDLLTSYDGSTITYDEIGNPLNDGTWEYTWEHGRQLASMTDGTVTVDYEYNADGIRTRKTVSTASDHSHIFQARVVAPTCTENGYTLHECSCGYSWQSNPVAATGHSFTTTEVEATCTAHGYTLVECECGYGYQEGSQGHSFTDTVIAPTAESNGYTLHECACGYSYQDTPVASLGITNPTANGTAANTVVYDYVYNGSSLSYLTVTSTNFGAESVTEELYFGNGTVAYGDDVYYYVTNLQGDVVAIIDADGNVKVEYTYDAWGKILSVSGPMADTLGTVNPLTYRGYVYDTETDLYYLESRYYDPTMERFLNHDVVFDTDAGLQGYNLFLYCANSPIYRIDISGADSEKLDDCDSEADDQLCEKGGGSPGGGSGGYPPSTNPTIVDNPNAGKGPQKDSSIKESPKAFRKALQKLTGFFGKGKDAHHIFPKKFQSIFKKFGINVHDAQYGAWWESKDHRKNSYEYNKRWEEFLNREDITREDIFRFVDQLLKEFSFDFNISRFLVR